MDILSIKFNNIRDTLEMAKNIDKYDYPYLIYSGFIMASKNSSLKNPNAARDYFNIMISENNYSKDDFKHLVNFSKEYEVEMGRMLHNYTYLKYGLNFSIRTKITNDQLEVIIINSYDKIGQKRSISRSMQISNLDFSLSPEWKNIKSNLFDPNNLFKVKGEISNG